MAQHRDVTIHIRIWHHPTTYCRVTLTLSYGFKIILAECLLNEKNFDTEGNEAKK